MLEMAKLVEITDFTKGQQAEAVPAGQGGKEVEVQFNPQSLRLSFANNNKGGDQPGGSSGKQFVGSGTSSMSVELVFDTSEKGSDVRKKTEAVAYFVMAKPAKSKQSKRVPPRVRFIWGSFVFEGVVDSMEETLDYFAEEGVPLRANVSLRLSRDDIAYVFGTPRPPDNQPQGGGPGAPGTTPLEPARTGDSVQSMAARAGRSGDWKAIAAFNGIDDPLRLQAGALLNLNVGVGLSASAGGGLGASVGAGIGASAGAGGAASAGAQAGFSAGLGGGVGFAATGGGSAGVGASGGLGGGAGVGASASAGLGGGGSAGASVGLSGGVSAGAGIGVGGTASR